MFNKSLVQKPYLIPLKNYPCPILDHTKILVENSQKNHKIGHSSLKNYFWGICIMFFVPLELTKGGVSIKISFSYSKMFLSFPWKCDFHGNDKNIFVCFQGWSFFIACFIWRTNWLKLGVNIAFQKVICVQFLPTSCLTAPNRVQNQSSDIWATFGQKAYFHLANNLTFGKNKNSILHFLDFFDNFAIV